MKTIMVIALAWALYPLSVRAESSSICPLDKVLPKADRYWGLFEGIDGGCRALVTLAEIDISYDRFKNEMHIYFNPAANCGGGDGSSSKGCPQGLSVTINPNRMETGMSCEANGGKIELTMPTGNRVPGAETMSFVKDGVGYSVALRGKDSNCRLDLTGFGPDSRPHSL